MTDIDVYNSIQLEDLWVYDKLILSKKLNYRCNPAGIPVDRHGWYIVKPITNLRGLGAFATKQFLTPESCNIPPGYFYQEYFEGVHRSVDYENGKHLFTVKAIKSNLEFKLWERDNIIPKTNKLLDYFIEKYSNVNVEYIGDKIIEIHLRYNPDFYNKNCLFYL